MHDENSMPPAQHWFSDSYVDEMHRILGPDACRSLSIYKLPPSFRLSVIIPVFNECETVTGVIDCVIATGLPVEIIIVDDGSRDGSEGKLRQCQSSRPVKLICHPVNHGKGAAIKSGLKQATGDIVVIQDADNEYDPNDFRVLLAPLIHSEADVVYGTRYGHCDRQLSPWWHQAVNSFLTALASVAMGPRLSDVETCYKMAFKKHFDAIADDLQENRFGIEIELTARWARLGLRFTERPIRYHHRWYDDGKKIGWKDGVAAVWCILKYGFLRR